MRFLIDMGLSPRLAQVLRDRGHDTIHLRDEGLATLSDEAIVRKAQAESRIILTHDLDFSRLMAVGGEESPSTVTFRLSDMRPGNVLLHLVSALGAFEKELLEGALVTIGDKASRCRALPL